VAVQVLFEALQKSIHDVGMQLEDEFHAGLVQTPGHAGGYLQDPGQHDQLPKTVV
jgi:hypothetical protein